MRRKALQGALVIATEDGDGVLHRCPGERGVVPVALVLTLVEEYMNQVAKVIQENDRQVVDASRVDAVLVGVLVNVGALAWFELGVDDHV